MRHLRIIPLGALFLTPLFLLPLGRGSLVSIESPNKSVRQVATGDASVEIHQLVHANNQFGVDLYSQLRIQKGNLSFSPLSLGSGLSMLYLGANGNTKKELASVLHLPPGSPRVAPGFGSLQKRIIDSGKNDDFSLLVANRLWGQKGYPINRGFLAATRKYYGAEFGQLDFQGSCYNSLEEINAWVADKTQKKITGIISPELIDANTKLVMTNAIYLKALWEKPFCKRFTSQQPFFVNNKQRMNVPMMGQQDRFRYSRIGKGEMVELPYKGKHVSMLILLPGKSQNLFQLEKSLSAKNFARWHNQLRFAEVAVLLPRFDVSLNLNLVDPLSRLGLNSVFNDAADLSGIWANGQNLAVTNVVHRATISVDEFGTEAAGATGVVSSELANPIVFNANRPFLFVIYHNDTGSILFLGRVNNPRAG